jgi:hypothetical protein
VTVEGNSFLDGPRKTVELERVLPRLRSFVAGQWRPPSRLAEGKIKVEFENVTSVLVPRHGLQVVSERHADVSWTKEYALLNGDRERR